jgi:anti-sigma B factor antagonist
MDHLNEQLDIETSTLTPDQRLLVVRGEIDYRTAPTLHAAIDSALDGVARRLVLDLEGVTFIDSSGLAVLIDASTRASVVLRHPSTAVERVIAVTGLSSTLHVTDRDQDT